MSNPFAALDEVEGSSKKQEKKTVEKSVPKTQEKPKTTEKPKEVTQEKPKPKPKTTEKTAPVIQDGFEQVGKTQRGGRPQRGSERGRGGDRGSSRGSRGGDRGSTRGSRGGDRGSSRGGGFTRPPRTDSNTGSEEVPSKDIREKSEHKKSEFRNERTGEPKQGNARGRGRFHDHHLSGTGTRGGFKKRGGGGHNWGTPKDELEVEKEVETATEETKEETKEEVVDPVNLSEDQKKVLRKKRKEAEKKERKGVGKKDDGKKEKSDELSIDQVKVVKVDPNQKTFEEYQKEKSKKAPTEVKAEVNKPYDLKADLFKSSGDKKKATTAGPTKKDVPKVSNSKDFPTLK